jgi:hypothetical protein
VSGAGGGATPGARDDGPAAPLDPHDPRFVGVGRGRPAADRPRVVVPGTGPGTSRYDPRVRLLRAAVPVLFLAAVVTVLAVFAAGLGTGPTVQPLGPAARIRGAVRDGPRRVCLEGEGPCAWLSVVGGQFLALSTAGPLREERGRLGVAWCPSSGYYWSPNTGSLFDRLGRVAGGPAPRGLDRHLVVREAGGTLALDFTSLRTGLQAERTSRVTPPAGPSCTTAPFDPPDLEVPSPAPGR